jgi:hypothetical protein
LAAVPSAFVILNEFPLTLNKKIDRRKLPKPSDLYAVSSVQYVEPCNAIEKELQSIWMKILKVKQISVIENFFNLGGHSLHIPQIIAKINETYKTSLTIRQFILNSTIRELSLIIFRDANNINLEANNISEFVQKRATG